MAPRPKQEILETIEQTGLLFENDSDINSEEIQREQTKLAPRKYDIVWFNVVFLTACHVIAAYGWYAAAVSAKWTTLLFTICTLFMNACGITGGAHRLWTHKAYKATLPLKILLLVCQTSAHQNSVIEWSRDHRVHHKFQETDADPHNAKRGFFFSHMGWLLCRKHEDVKTIGKAIDMSDLYAEPLLAFQHKYFNYLMPIFCFILPTWMPMVLWNETFLNAFTMNMAKYILSLHGTWLVNSAAHMWGMKPYDRFINPTENLFVALCSNGEGWHNYHHTFPWDYRTGEMNRYNPTTLVINMFAKIGWAYDLKTVSDDVIRKRVARTGDGSHDIWGWGDKDQTEDDYKSAIILNRKNE